MYKYTLIVSQYYHSYHQFIVKFDDKVFIENARNFVRDLNKYKSQDTNRDYLGDLDPKYIREGIARRYNVNDAGDIYIINHNDLMSLLNDVKYYEKEYSIFSKGRKRKQIENDILNNHNYYEVKKILEKYFELL